MSYETLKEVKEDWKQEKYSKIFEKDFNHFSLRIYEESYEMGYTVQRFFKIGDKWEISVDLQHGVFSEVIDKIINLFER